MELRSYKTYIDKLVTDNFDFAIFSPENSDKLFDIFKKNFYRDTPYWREREGAMDGDLFYIEFKKFGENRRRVFLKFSFLPNFKKPRELTLTLTNDDFKVLDEMSVKVPLSDIWKDHAILIEHLKKYCEKGLNLAA